MQLLCSGGTLLGITFHTSRDMSLWQLISSVPHSRCRRLLRLFQLVHMPHGRNVLPINLRYHVSARINQLLMLTFVKQLLRNVNVLSTSMQVHSGPTFLPGLSYVTKAKPISTMSPVLKVYRLGQTKQCHCEHGQIGFWDITNGSEMISIGYEAS
jgi:hypothetical protein